MSNIVINCDYYFRRRLEKAQETVGDLMTGAPATNVTLYTAEHAENALEELETYLDRLEAAQRELKYFLEDLAAAISKE